MAYSTNLNSDSDYGTGDPVRNLWSQVINNALERPYSHQAQWFFTSKESRFEWICFQLGYSADDLRKRILKTY